MPSEFHETFKVSEEEKDAILSHAFDLGGDYHNPASNRSISQRDRYSNLQSAREKDGQVLEKGDTDGLAFLDDL